MISLFSLHFRTNTHFYPTGFTSSGVWTTSQKTSRFVNEFNSACIASFHFWPIISMSTFFHISLFGIFIISYDIKGHLESKNIVNNNIISTPLPLLECQVFLGFSSSRELHHLSRQVYHASFIC